MLHRQVVGPLARDGLADVLLRVVDDDRLGSHRRGTVARCRAPRRSLRSQPRHQRRLLRAAAGGHHVAALHRRQLQCKVACPARRRRHQHLLARCRAARLAHADGRRRARDDQRRCLGAGRVDPLAEHRGHRREFGECAADKGHRVAHRQPLDALSDRHNLPGALGAQRKALERAVALEPVLGARTERLAAAVDAREAHANRDLGRPRGARGKVHNLGHLPEAAARAPRLKSARSRRQRRRSGQSARSFAAAVRALAAPAQPSGHARRRSRGEEIRRHHHGLTTDSSSRSATQRAARRPGAT
mmetsp:Transcript_1381/g.4061  ORF Transcript_1381/g.4061 Transcript_1381/m.4061 type:complete len:302 (-) Transcript_1381:160-1065(-)